MILVLHGLKDAVFHFPAHVQRVFYKIQTAIKCWPDNSYVHEKLEEVSMNHLKTLSKHARNLMLRYQQRSVNLSPRGLSGLEEL